MARKKSYKRPVMAIAKALARVDWRLNFYQPSPLDCGIVSPRGAKLPKILASMAPRSGSACMKIGVPRNLGPLPLYAKAYRLILRKDFIELHCDIMLLQRLVVMYGVKLRCNYQLEALEQVIRGPLMQYKEIAAISDGRWNQFPEFRQLLNRGVYAGRRLEL